MKRVLSAAGRRMLVGGATALCAIAQRGGAQTADVGGRSRWALGLAADVGEVPGVMAAQCGFGEDGSVPMAGGGAALLFTPRSWLVVASDVRISGVMPTGCKLIIPPPVQLGDGQWESPTSRDYRDVPTSPLTRSAVRVGVQTPRGVPLIRATVGGGLLWSSAPVPYGAATLGIGTRGSHVRFYAELEGDVARVRAFDERTIYHIIDGGVPVLDSRTSTPVVLHPHWVTGHIGVELPFAWR